jgi:hypothetical protein
VSVSDGMTRRTLLRRSPAVLGLGAALQVGYAELASAAAATPAGTFAALMDATSPDTADTAAAAFRSSLDRFDPGTRESVAALLRRVETEAGPHFATLPRSTRRGRIESALRPLLDHSAKSGPPVRIEVMLAAPLPPLVAGSDGCDVEADPGCIEQRPATRPDGARSVQDLGATVVSLGGLGADLLSPKPSVS